MEKVFCHKQILKTFCLGIVLSLHQAGYAQLPVETKAEPVVGLTIPTLKGDEILCEIEVDAYNGIFSVDTSKQNPIAVPIVENAHSPQWAPKHTVFSFFRRGLIWVGDCEGRIQPVGLIPRNAQEFEMHWDNAGRPYAIYRIPGWTQVFARGINLKEDSARMLLKERKPMNLKFGETIIMKSDRLSKEQRTIEVETGPQGKRIKEQAFLSQKVKATGAVSFSPDNKRFVMQLNDGSPYGGVSQSHLWLFETIDSNVNDPNYSRESFLKKIKENDYSRFYDENSIIPKASFVKELTGQDRAVFELNPRWSPDGKMLAYTQVNIGKEEIWPHVLTGPNFERDVAISIPDYLPFETERWAKKSVEVLSWEPDGTLFLIEGTRDKIYQVKQTPNGFEASIFVEIQAGGKPHLMYPVFHKEWLAYVLSIDNYSAVHLKNYKTGEERLLKLAISGKADGSIRNLSW